MAEINLGLKAELDNTIENGRTSDTNATNAINSLPLVDVRRLLEGVRSGFISNYHIRFLKFGFNVNIIYDSNTPCFRIYSGKTNEYIPITRSDRHDETLLQALEILKADGLTIEYTQGYSKYNDDPYWRIIYIPTKKQ